MFDERDPKICNHIQQTHTVYSLPPHTQVTYFINFNQQSLDELNVSDPLYCLK